MPASYDRLGVHFAYPENWRLEEEEAISWPRAVSVESPSGAFWSVMIHEEGTDPERIAEQTLEVLRGEYEEVEYEPIWEELGERPVKGYDLEFFYLDLLIRIQLRAFWLQLLAEAAVCLATFTLVSVGTVSALAYAVPDWSAGGV